jgi:hypothetical protein
MVLSHTAIVFPIFSSVRKAVSKTISFAEIINRRNASLQVTDDKILDLVDLVMVLDPAWPASPSEAVQHFNHSLTGKEGRDRNKVVQGWMFCQRQKLRKLPVTFCFHGMHRPYSAIILLEHGLNPPTEP